MAREKLSAVHVRQSPAGKYGDGGGLWLLKSSKDTGSWMLRVAVHGRLRHMGLGSIADVSLADARLSAAKWRSVARDGRDPIRERERHRRDAARNLHLLEDVAKDAFEARKAGLRGEGKAGRWYGPLENHVLPKLGKTPVADIDQIAIRDTLRPIWKEKASTAEKAIQRLNIVMKHAAALGYAVDLQACAKAQALLGAQGHEVQNIPSVPWQDVPAFYASLSDGSATHLALRFLILSGLRSAPVRLARRDHIVDDVMTVPAELMKGQKGKANDFRVPLSPEVLAIIEEAKPQSRNGLIFSSPRGVAMSDMTLSRLMQRREMKARPHGFRSSLRIFLAEKGCPRDIAEMILAHSVMGKVEASYMRSDLLDIRRGWMDRWSRFVTTGKDEAKADVPTTGELIEMRAGVR
ncbi:integrase arm-type DNA-binding domain-containing protein [Bradyrhizobium sp. BEA-2-5]|uniref:tyrosine-type recombinase/integrase n=1 Tax=Bradyrhizobium sp. BEA-2-5 TaxID=3080015 RepID=UPI00293F2A49|nr:integrase arm-type DNA-binding domain-containing protein [Bradyrhizobium sp. BEA-2-5]WOH79006.1 integrase arm-type DNA-binding domain-containing protein [Bradyrhizobium sp. BEA-2-5]